MLITKQQILTAIAEEPLAPNHWIDAAGKPGCTVCAVGAVLRNCGVADSSINSTASAWVRGRYTSEGAQWRHEVSDMVAAGRWLNVLSVAFESLCEPVTRHRSGRKWIPEVHLIRIRRELAAYVRDTFPDSFTAP